MPWYAQREGLPDSHRHYVHPGSQREHVFRRLGYVEVPAPGHTEPEPDPLVDDFGDPYDDLHGQPLSPDDTFDDRPRPPDRS